MQNRSGKVKQYKESYSVSGWRVLMWIGFFLGFRGCIRLPIVIIASAPIGNSWIYPPYLFGGLLELILFCAVIEWAVKKNPEKTTWFLAAIYTLGILGWISANPVVWLVYYLYLLPMYKAYQGQIYGEHLVQNNAAQEKRFQGYRCDPEVDLTERCLIYNNRHLDKEKLLRGEIEYLSTLPREQLEDGYKRFKKNKKLKRKAPVFRKILLEAYNDVLFPEEQEDLDFLQALDETRFGTEACTNREIKGEVEKQYEQEAGFSWLRAVEMAEGDLQDLRELQQTEDNEDNSWLSLIEETENYRMNSSDQKAKVTSSKRESVGAIIGGIAVITCVATVGVVGAIAFNHASDNDRVVSSTIAESDKGSSDDTAEEAGTADFDKSNRLTAEDREEIAAGVAARKAEKERKKAASSSSDSQEKPTVLADNSVQDTAENTAAEIETGNNEQTIVETPEETEETTPEENVQNVTNTADTYLEDTYNNYAAQIQSESASLVSQLQAGTIDYMTASQQLSNLYNTGNQVMSNYWMNGNCSYADMTTWSNKLWSVYTAESPKLVGAGQ